MAHRSRNEDHHWMTLRSWDPEALSAWLNEYAPFKGAGVRITHIAKTADELHVEMPLTPGNTNVVGTHFGGSLYSMVDPHLMLLLMGLLGPEYIIWDKEASINFHRPGIGVVRAKICITEEELKEIRAATATGDKHFPKWRLAILDEDGELVATVAKTLYVRRKHEGSNRPIRQPDL